MTSLRIRILVTSLLALLLIASGGLWKLTSAPEATTNEPSSLVESPTTTTETDPAQRPTDPTTNISIGDRVDAEVRADIAVNGQTEVVVVFDAEISGTDDDKRAQVQAGIQAITSALPAGSWSIVGDTSTVPVANLVIDESALSALEQQPGITHVDSALHEFFPAEISDPTSLASEVGPSANSATMGVSGISGTWAAGFKGAGTTIAVVDTGVQTNHPFLMRGTTQKTIGEACFASYCPGGAPMETSDPSKVGAGAPCRVDFKACQHGTHVAGIAAGGDGTGTTGVAPDASLISVQVFSYMSSMNRIIADRGNINKALQWLYERRLDFPGLVAVNLSLGDERKYSETRTCDAKNFSTYELVQQLLDVGIVTVVAAGNNYWSDGVSAPGCLSNVVTVSALTGGSGADQRGEFSNVGQPYDADHPDGFNILFAPGTFDSSIPCDGYDLLSGTSMATPAVAGSIAALHQPEVDVAGRKIRDDDTFSLLQRTGTAVTDFSAPSVKLNSAIASLPGPPRSVAGSASGTQVAVSWLAPIANSGTVTGYTVTAIPGGRTCSTAGLTCTVTSLDPTKTYVFTVNAIGTGGIGAGASTAPIPMPNVPAVPTDYVPLNPVRLLDTRSVSTGASTIDGNDLGCGPVGQQQVRTLMVEGRGGVPAVGVDAVAVNVTVVSPTASNFLTVYPNGTARPDTSTINFVAGQTIPNMAIVKVGADGRIAIFNAQGSTQVVIDVVGWFPDGSDYTGVIPQRLLDTRTAVEGGGGTIDGAFRGIGSVGQGQTLVLPVIGRGTIPASGVGAVALNVTAVSPTASNFLTVYPSGTALPNASNLNFVAGQTIANMVIAKVGVDGNVAIYNAQGTTQVVVDIIGWFPTISEYTGIVPERFLDTRTCDGCLTFDDEYVGIGPLGPSVSLPLQITGRGSIPSSGVGSVALNVTVAGSSASGYLTVYPSGATLPTASNLNFLPGQIVPNMVIVKLGGDGQIAIFNSSGLTSVVVDVVGWFPS